MSLPVACLTDQHKCPMWTGVVPHIGIVIAGPGATTVLAGNLPVSIAGDTATCSGPPATTIGTATVLASNKPVVRLTDLTSHGGVVTGPGCATVLVGGPAPPAPPPPPDPPSELSADEVALMLTGASEEDLARYRQLKEDGASQQELDEFTRRKEEENA